MTAAMIPVPITDTATMRRLIEFAGDVTQLANERLDLDLRELIDGLHRDLLVLRGDERWMTATPIASNCSTGSPIGFPSLTSTNEVACMTLPDDHEALLVNGGGIDGGAGAFIANAGEDLHVVGSVEPLIPGHVGCIVLAPDGSRRLARVVADPLAEQKPHQVSVLIGTPRRTRRRFALCGLRQADLEATARILRRELVLGDLFARLGRPVR
jgi:hypothetical protein